MPDWLAQSALLQFPAMRLLSVAVIACAGGLLAYAISRILAIRVRRLGARTTSGVPAAVAAALEHSSIVLLIVLAGLLASHLLQVSSQARIWLDRGAFLLAGLQIGLWMNAAIRTLTRERLGRAGDGPANPVVTAILGWFLRILVWSTLVLAVLGNIGVNITAFVASLGIGGVAVALALQNVLGDLFASLSIGLDKPFSIGDFIAFDDDLGTVTHVGVKTTRIRSLRGEELAIGNARLLGKTVHNYSRMATRRIVFEFGLAMGTSHERVREVIDAVREIVGGMDGIKLDRAHFRGFGESSLDFEVVYIVQSADYGTYMDIQQQINLALMARLHDLDAHFAMPLRVVHTPTLPQGVLPGSAS
ncbi:mechanosensitive ion channel family protein [Dokdonella sp.]|uniref:mechanosensitive ion channel family protein n=1 Tax=Dokdonella sp. TaxID=2291710 RepID=UPI0031C361A6|nr:mechanosensitive ion channel family protein [Dokdonella sp.]